MYKIESCKPRPTTPCNSVEPDIRVLHRSRYTKKKILRVFAWWMGERGRLSKVRA